MIEFSNLNWLGILAATVAHMILGAVWFGVFAKPWSRLAHPGKTEEQIQAGPKWIYAIATVGGLVTAIVLDATLQATGAEGIGDALVAAVVFWVGFVLVKYATTYAFEWRSWTLLAIDTGYPLVSMLAAAAILGLWP